MTVDKKYLRALVSNKTINPHSQHRQCENERMVHEKLNNMNIQKYLKLYI
jgi:hypothetical protein